MSTLNKITSIDDLNLNIELIHESILKHIYINGRILGKEISDSLKVSFNLIEEELVFLKKREYIVIAGASSIASGFHGMEFELTNKGRERTRDIMAQRSYVGPLPVTIDDYKAVITKKQIKTRSVTRAKISSLYEDMILEDQYFNKLGPAINSGGPILLFGKAGNGKTMIAEKIVQSFDDYIYVPYCLMVDGQYIKYFDEKIHEVISYKTLDERWVKIKRPYIVVGGELTLEMLDLTYKNEFKYYEAPLQLKANGGILLIDDFGRQLLSPKELLNRWIYPLEKKIDYLTLVTGKKVEVPFNQMLVFSSNLKPQELGDDAFLRRIKYKIEITNPSTAQFKTIFENECHKRSIKFSPNAFEYLLKKYYLNEKRDIRGCHSRDLISHILDFNIYYNRPMTLSKENLDFACQSYFSVFR